MQKKLFRLLFINILADCFKSVDRKSRVKSGITTYIFLSKNF